MDFSFNDNKVLIERQKRIRKDIVEQYIRARKERHLTQEELAKILHVKRPNISRFESGEYNPTVDMLVKMADCLDMKLVIELKMNEREKNG